LKLPKCFGDRKHSQKFLLFALEVKEISLVLGSRKPLQPIVMSEIGLQVPVLAPTCIDLQLRPLKGGLWQLTAAGVWICLIYFLDI